MGKGKIAAQCAHAAVECYRHAAEQKNPFLNTWLHQGQRKIVLKEHSESALLELRRIALERNINNRYKIHLNLQSYIH
jgi:peptidyl-tRNA hydrolase, PTH2 family